MIGWVSPPIGIPDEPSWADIEKAALHDPWLHWLVTVVRLGVPRELALMRFALEVAESNRRLLEQRIERAAVRPPGVPPADWPVCDTCGAPATGWGRDTLEHRAPGAPFVVFKPIGGLKFGCEAHPVQLETHRTALPAVG